MRFDDSVPFPCPEASFPMSFVLRACLTLLVPTAAVATLAPGALAADAQGKGVRVFRLAGPVAEADDPWDLLGLDERTIFSELLEAVDAAATDAEVGTIVLQVGNIDPGPARARELAVAVSRARAGGKRIVAHLRDGSPTSLLIATAADEVSMTPEGSVFLPGVRAEVTYIKPLLDTIGVEADIEAVGRYKSAPEPLMRTSMSTDAREALEALVDDLYTTTLDDLARQRRLGRKKAEALFDRGMLTAEEARRAGLIDSLSYWTDLLERLEARAGQKPTLAWPVAAKLPDLTSFFGLLELLTSKPSRREGGAARVALLVAEGPIVMGRDPGDLMDGGPIVATDELLRAIREIRDDGDIDAVVLRIDSPGGSALASDVIWRAIDQLDDQIPVVASLGNVAASGGYYIASAARRIVAEPSTVTGSIGVFGGKLVIGGLLDKAGLQTTVISRGRHAGLFSALTRFTDAEREVLRRVMQHTYDTFVNRVARGRSMSYDAVDRVAQGRVWSGRAAMAKGLVDSMGGIHEATTAAARLAGVDPAATQLVPFPGPRSFMDMLERRGQTLRAPRLDLSGLLGSLLPRALVTRAVGLAALLGHLFDGEVTLAMLPFVIELD